MNNPDTLPVEPTPQMDLPLSDTHRQALKASAIAPEVIRARPYFTVTDRKEMQALGFSPEQCNTPALLIAVHGLSGVGMGYVARPDKPRERNGKPVKYETPRGSHMTLDVHPSARGDIGNPNVPLFITEGTKKGDSAVSRGLCCVNLIGVWTWRGRNALGGLTALSDFEQIALKGRKVYIAYDSDVMTKPSVYKALKRLKAFLEGRGAEVSIIYLPPGDGGAKVGMDDYFAAGHSADDLLALATRDLRPPAPEEGTAMEPAERLVEIGGQDELFTDGRECAYAAFRMRDHTETVPVRSSAYRDRLTRQFYEDTGGTPRAAAMEEGLRTLEARARFDGERRNLGLRVIRPDERTVLYDLGDAKRRVVRMTDQDWEIVEDPEPLFRRYPLSQAQVEPTRHPASIEARLRQLFKVINVRKRHAWYLLVTWIIAAFLQDIAHPVLVAFGEQGSAKSTMLRILGMLIDPCRTPLRPEPRDPEQWALMADQSHMLALDNLSRLPPWFSDAVCRAVTGDSDSRRKLYSDTDQVFFDFRIVIALNGIEVVPERADLLDRSILLPMPRIAGETRRSETELMQEFERLRPIILGAIFDAVSGVLRELPNVRRNDLPRMADFARIGLAAERVLGWASGSFMAAYTANIAEQHDEVLFSSAVGGAIIKMMSYQKNGWQGTAAELLKRLGGHGRDWPASPRALSGLLNRLAPSLRTHGITIEIGRTHGGRFIKMVRDETPGPAHPTVTTDTPTRPAKAVPASGATPSVSRPAVPVSQTPPPVSQNAPPVSQSGSGVTQNPARDGRDAESRRGDDVLDAERGAAHPPENDSVEDDPFADEPENPLWR